MVMRLTLFLAVFLTFCISVQAGSLSGLGLLYAGEVKLAFEAQSGEVQLLPAYMLYIQGEPIPGLYLMTYLVPGGDWLDQILVRYTTKHWELEVGDTTLQEVGGQFYLLDQNQRGGALRYHLPGDVVELEVTGAVVKGINCRETITGNGTAGPYYLQNGPVVLESVRLERDGVPFPRGDYVLIVESGAITFQEPLMDGEEVLVSYTYLPGGGFYRRGFIGVNSQVEWHGINGRVGWFKITDEPLQCDYELTKFAGLPSKALEAVLVSAAWQGLPWLKAQNELTFSRMTGLLESNGWASEGLLRVGLPLTYLQGGYTFRSPGFLAGLNELEPDPLVHYQLQGRWQVHPLLNLTGSWDYSHDNPNRASEQITTHEELQLLKGVWQVSPASSLQIAFQQKDEGDDVQYLPLGEILRSVSLAYRYRAVEQEANWISGLISLSGGERVWKDAAPATRNYQFVQMSSILDWQWGKWNSNVQLNPTYMHLLAGGGDLWKANGKFQLKRRFAEGEVILGGEEVWDEDYQRHLQEVRVKQQMNAFWTAQLTYRRNAQFSPTGGKKLEETATVQCTYCGPVQLELKTSAQWQNQLFNNSTFQARLETEQAELQFNLMHQVGSDETSLKMKSACITGLTLETGLFYRSRQEESSSNSSLLNATIASGENGPLYLTSSETTLLWQLSGTYQLNAAVQLRGSADVPLILPGTNSTEAAYKLEIIICL